MVRIKTVVHHVFSTALGALAGKPKRAAACAMAEFFGKAAIAPSYYRRVTFTTLDAFFEQSAAAGTQSVITGVNIAFVASHVMIVGNYV